MKMLKANSVERGFSLLEVLAAVTILAGVLFATSRIISASYIYASKVHNIYLGTELAKLKLHDVELMIQEEGLPEDEREEEGDFEDREYEDFHWKYSIKRVFLPLPDFTSSDSDSSALDETAGMLSMAKGNIEDFFKERIRKLTVSVHWDQGVKESEKVTLTIFLTTNGTATTFQQYDGSKANKNNNNGKGSGNRPKSQNNRFNMNQGSGGAKPAPIQATPGRK